MRAHVMPSSELFCRAGGGGAGAGDKRSIRVIQLDVAHRGLEK